MKAALLALTVAAITGPALAQASRERCAPQDIGKRCTPAIRSGEAGKRSGRPIDTLRDMFAELGACWTPPAGDQYRPGMEVTVRMGFRADGTLLGEPRFTYFSGWAPARIKQAYRESVVSGLAGCVPLRFTPGMGGAIAGRVILFRYIDNRNTQRI